MIVSIIKMYLLIYFKNSSYLIFPVRLSKYFDYSHDDQILNEKHFDYKQLIYYYNWQYKSTYISGGLYQLLIKFIWHIEEQ